MLVKTNVSKNQSTNRIKSLLKLFINILLQAGIYCRPNSDVGVLRSNPFAVFLLQIEVRSHLAVEV